MSVHPNPLSSDVLALCMPRPRRPHAVAIVGMLALAWTGSALAQFVQHDHYVSPLDIVVNGPGGSEVISFTGSMWMDIEFESVEGASQDDDLDSREELDAEIVSLNVAGTSALGLGAVTIQLGTLAPTIGVVEEATNTTPGRIDVPPFTIGGSADMTAAAYLEVEIGGVTYHNVQPLRGALAIPHSPPASIASWFLNSERVELYDASGVVSPYSLGLLPPDVPTQPFDANYGFAWANQPTIASYSPNALYRHNPTGGTVLIERSGVGAYRVTFPGMVNMGLDRGNAQVSAYESSGAGPDDHACRAIDWDADWVEVRCATRTGVPLDSRFTVLFLKSKLTSDGIAYARTSLPFAASHTLPASDGWNPSGGDIVVTRSGVGSYGVVFDGFAGLAFAGNVQITSMGAPTARCTVVEWVADFVEVRCVNSVGTPIDSEFSVLYLLEAPSFLSDVAWSWGFMPSNDRYDAGTSYSASPDGGSTIIERTGPGAYEIRWVGYADHNFAGSGGHAQVTAYRGAGGLAGGDCGIRSWSQDRTGVRCFDTFGTPADQPFSVMHLRPLPTPEPGTAISIAVGGLAVGRLARSRRRRRFGRHHPARVAIGEGPSRSPAERIPVPWRAAASRHLQGHC